MFLETIAKYNALIGIPVLKQPGAMIKCGGLPIHLLSIESESIVLLLV